MYGTRGWKLFLHQVFELQTDIFAQREQSVTLWFGGTWTSCDICPRRQPVRIKFLLCVSPSLPSVLMVNIMPNDLSCQATAMPLPSQIPTCPHPASFTLEATSCVTNLIQIMVHPVNSRFRLSALMPFSGANQPDSSWSDSFLKSVPLTEERNLH